MTDWEKDQSVVKNYISESENFAQWNRSSRDCVVVRSYAKTPNDGIAYVIDDRSDKSNKKGLCYISKDIDGREIDGRNVTFSVFVLRDEVPASDRFLAIRIEYIKGKQEEFADVCIDTSTGKTTTNTPGFVSGYGAMKKGKFWRLWVSARHAWKVNRVWIVPAAGRGAETFPYKNNVIGSATVFGAQLESGLKPTGYIKTEGAAVTAEKLTSWAVQ
jgi:hypothetical protein